MRTHARRVLALGAVALFSLRPAVASAQIVEEGIARDGKLGTPLECLHVALLDSSGQAIAHTVTDSEGRFLLEAARPGVYRLRFSMFAWEPLVAPPDTLTEGAFKQRAYPLEFVNMLVADTAYIRLAEGQTPGAMREKYRHVDSLMRSGESDSGWRSRRPLPTPMELTYPTKQRREGVTGSVLARFIVDSTGRAREESLQTLYASHPDFEAEIRSSLPRSRWLPARIGGKPVCEMTMDFSRFFLEGSIARIVLYTR
jgi:hypothetical protein